MKRVARIGGLVAVVWAAAVAGGCLKIDSTLDVSADGSGKWRLVYSMPSHMLKQVQNAAALAVDLQRAAGISNAVAVPLDLPFLYDETTIRNRLAPLAAEGIRIAKLDVKPRAGWPTVELTLQFDRLETLMKQPFLADVGAVYRRDADGTGRLTLTAPRLGVGGKLPDLADPKVSANVTPFLAGLSVISRVSVPGTVRNTNAGMNDGRRATWEWDFERDARAVERMSEAKMIVVFDAAATGMKPFEKAVKPRSE